MLCCSTKVSHQEAYIDLDRWIDKDLVLPTIITIHPELHWNGYSIEHAHTHMHMEKNYTSIFHGGKNNFSTNTFL